jgi:hypothetical protein
MEPEWSPYLAGAGIGVLVCLSLLLSDRPIGCSTAYVKACGLIEQAVNKKSADTCRYYREIVPAIDRQFMIVPGIIIGAFLAAVLGGTFHPVIVPALWASAFGDNPALRIGVAILGGALLALGARWAGGCTSGHGISGNIQLALSSMVSATCFFIGGILTAFFLFGIIGA